MTTLATLFAEGQRVPELDDSDFAELLEIVSEDAARRGLVTVTFTQDEAHALTGNAPGAALVSAKSKVYDTADAARGDAS